MNSISSASSSTWSGSVSVTRTPVMRAMSSFRLSRCWMLSVAQTSMPAAISSATSSPSFVVAAARRIGVGKLVHQQQAGPAREGGVLVEFLQHLAAIGDRLAGQQRQRADHGGGVRAAMGFDHADQHIPAGIARARGGGEHLPCLADTGRGAEEHLQAAMSLTRRGGEQRVGVGALVFHAGTLVRRARIENPAGKIEYALAGICVSEHIRAMQAALSALADPIRRNVLDVLRQGERSAGEIERTLKLSQPAASKHLRALRQAGLVRMRPDAQRRLYRIDPAPLAALEAWLATFRHFWAGRLDALEHQLDEEK